MGTYKLSSNNGKKILLVANVAKEHVLKFHIPTINALKEKDWQVDVACVMDEEINECDTCWNMKYQRNPISIKTIEGVVQLKGILKQQQYKIVYCHTPTGALAARLAVLGLKNKPAVIYMAHGFHFYKGAPIKNWLLYYPMERILAHWTDFLITINQEDYELARNKKMYKRGIYKIPGIGVDLKRLSIREGDNPRKRIRKELGIKSDDCVLIYVAELIPNKNQGKLIDVLAKLKEKKPNIKLLLVGPDHNSGLYQKYAQKLNLSESVIFTGWRSDVGDLLHASDICVASSIREGFGLNLVEAMACGLPVVAFDNRGHREIVLDDKNGYLVAQGDIATMTEKILLVLDSKYAELSKNALKSSDNYEQERVTSQIVDIIEKAFKG